MYFEGERQLAAQTRSQQNEGYASTAAAAAAGAMAAVTYYSSASIKLGAASSQMPARTDLLPPIGPVALRVWRSDIYK
jgi:hypothetical protein